MKNEIYEEGISGIITRVEKGVPLSAELLKNPIFPPLIGQMVAVGEETGKISEMLMSVANYYEEEVDQKAKNLSTIIEPILMIIIGIGVGIFAIAMLAPTYSLVDYI